MKEFLLLIREDLQMAAQVSAEDMHAEIQKHIDWVEILIEKGHYKSGNPLETSGKIVSSKNGLITDGPFVEAREGIGGYYFIAASNLDEAAKIAKGCPSLAYGTSIEIREVILT